MPATAVCTVTCQDRSCMSFFADFPKGPEERVANQEVVETVRSDGPLPREQMETTRLHVMAER